MKRALITGISGLALTEDEKNFILRREVMPYGIDPDEEERIRAVLDLGEGGRDPAVALHRGDVESHRGW